MSFHKRADGMTVGEVAWVGDEAFTRGGDSGALVYAVIDQRVLPLGLHCGAYHHKGVSVFITLKFLVGEYLSLVRKDVVFCSEETCWC